MLGFEPKTFRQWVSSHNHYTRLLPLQFIIVGWNDKKEQTFKDGAELASEPNRSNIGVLANGTFQEEARDADGDKHHEVGNDECPTSVLEAEVGETPDVAQSWRKIIGFGS